MAATVLLGIACRPGPIEAPAAHAAPASRVANLHAFARLYGVLRWFHPSDAAAVIDWDRFAIEGARRVADAPNVAALRSALGELIAPFAPTVHLAGAGEAFPDEPALHPPDAAKLDVVAWQHKGYGDTAVTGLFGSKRRHRERTVRVAGLPYGALSQTVDATPYRGQRLRLRGKLRTVTPGRGHLWVRVERGDAVVVSEDMADRPVVSPTWGFADLVVTVDAAATRRHRRASQPVARRRVEPPGDRAPRRRRLLCRPGPSIDACARCRDGNASRRRPASSSICATTRTATVRSCPTSSPAQTPRRRGSPSRA